MRLVTLFLLAAFATSTVDAALYQKTDAQDLATARENGTPDE
jgi:hypothetical protein